MTLYYFHSSNGTIALDEVGTDLADMAAVRREAVMISRETLLVPTGECPTLWDGVPSRLWVTDEPKAAGKTILTLEFSAAP